MADGTPVNYSQLAREGLISNNPAMVQLLGLCPLLAVSNSVVSSVGLGVTTVFVLTLSNLAVSLIRRFLDDSTRLPAQMLVIATFVTVADILLQVTFFDLHQRIGLFVALIVTNCALLGRAEAFASRQPVHFATVDGLMMGSGFCLVIIVMGMVREALGQGTLFAGMALGGVDLTIHLGNPGFLLMLLPPGAFLTLGCLIALKNRMTQP
jgi:Na+-translocating ferredoxin:NAD+ oxidoreductase subunit E